MEIPKNAGLPKLQRKVSSKKKILLLSDDVRLKSGVGTMSREIVRATLHKYDWLQIGGALDHPDNGKGLMDLSQDFIKAGCPADSSVKVFPVAGYGDPKLLRNMIYSEKPDAIMHFTDPRFWGWLYAMEHEIRQHTPLLYLNIWDDLPFPHWNEDFYESCDLLMAISKQTYNINKHVCQRKPRTNWDLKYVPHGIEEKHFFPIEEADMEFIKFKEDYTKNKDYNFVLGFNSRNIRRKSPSDLMLGFKKFCDMLPKEEADKCCLLMHTQPRDENGTDLPVVANTLAPDCNIYFSDKNIYANDYEIEANLIGKWDFSEGEGQLLYDRTGNANHATINGPTWSEDVYVPPAPPVIGGNNSLIFDGENERIALSPIAENRDIFAKGALKAAEWGQDKEPGLFSMIDVLGF